MKKIEESKAQAGSFVWVSQSPARTTQGPEKPQEAPATALEAKVPPIALPELCRILAEPARWRLIRELARGEAMPVKELARRIGKSAPLTSKHLAILREAGLVVAKYGRIYQLTDAFRPAPGATHLDFGHCLMRLDAKG